MNVESIKAICSLGTGTMGAGIAVVFSLAGYNVRMFGRSEESILKASKALIAL